MIDTPSNTLRGLRLSYDMDLHACVLLFGDEVVHVDKRLDVIDTYGMKEQHTLIHDAVERHTKNKGWGQS